MKENEIIFLVEESTEGGFEARALEHSIFTNGEDIVDLRRNVLDAVRCHFEERSCPVILKLHINS